LILLLLTEIEDSYSSVSRLYLNRKGSPIRFRTHSVGAPAGGMNAATRTAVRYCLARGHTPLAVYNSWLGLLDDNIAEIGWLRVDNWTTRGGSELGTNRTLPDVNLSGLAEKIKQHKIQSILIIGGFEALRSLMILNKASKDFPEFNIPMVQLPATISNNVPVTEWSLGSDTSINVLMEACDVVKQSASASRNRVFTVECQGGECGFIAIMGALAVSDTESAEPPSSFACLVTVWCCRGLYPRGWDQLGNSVKRY
jgi:6-phosphofructokinase 1